MDDKRYTIEDRIDILERFIKQYPALWANKTVANNELMELESAYLRFDSNGDEKDKKVCDELLKKINSKYGLGISNFDEAGKLKKQLEFCIRSFKYIYIRKHKGLLSEELAKRIEEIGFGGVLGSELETIRKRYKITKSLLRIIISKYGSLDNFRKKYLEYIVDLYTGQECEEMDFMGIEKHLVCGFDLSSPDLIFRNRGFAAIYVELFGEKNCIIDSGLAKDKLDVYLQGLNERARQIIKDYYGIDCAERKPFETIAKEHNISNVRVQQIKTAALNRLSKLENILLIGDVDKKSDMDKKGIEEFIRCFFEEHDIFYDYESFDLDKEARERLVRICENSFKSKNQQDARNAAKRQKRKEIKRQNSIQEQRKDAKSQFVKQLMSIITLYQIGISPEKVNEYQNISIAEWLRLNDESSDIEIYLKIKSLQENIEQEVEKSMVEEEIDFSIENLGILNLSRRARNLMAKAGIKTVGELVKLTKDKLLEIELLGQTTYIEILEKVHALGLNFADEHEERDEDVAHIRITCDIEGVKEKVLQEKREITPIEKLGLSSRPCNALKRYKINSVEKLLQMSQEEIRSFSYLGEKSFNEILEKVHFLGYKFVWEVEQEDEELENIIQQLKERYMELNIRIEELDVLIEKITKVVESKTRNLSIKEAQEQLEKIRKECFELKEERQKVIEQMDIMGISRD